MILTNTFKKLKYKYDINKPSMDFLSSRATMNKTFSVVLLAILLIFSALVQPGASSREAFEEGSETDVKNYMTGWLRDQDNNRIDDLIDRELAAGGQETELHIYVDLLEMPGPKETGLLEPFGSISYLCRYIPTVCMEGVRAGDVPKIAALPGVAMVEQQSLYRSLLNVSSPALRAGNSQKYNPFTTENWGYNGSGVNIAILDTGVDDGHPSLANSRMAGVDFTNPLGERDGSDDPDDDNGHGSHVAGIALGRGGGPGDPAGNMVGVAPAAGLIDVKILTALGSGWGQNLIEALEWCQDNRDTPWPGASSEDYHGIDIISISLGDGEDDDGQSADAREVNATVDSGIVVIAASGNNNGEAINSPGSADRAITVGAVDDSGTVDRSDDDIWFGSNYGPRADDGDENTLDEFKPDVVAPGVLINSCDYAVGEDQEYLGYVNKTGTSMATPHVAGLAALLLQANHSLIPGPLAGEEEEELEQNPVKRVLRERATPKGEPYDIELDPTYNQRYGWGLVDAYQALREVAPAPDLELSDCEPQNPQLLVGEDLDFTIDIRELEGVFVAGATLQVYLDEIEPEHLLHDLVFSLEAFEQKNFRATWQDALKGEHKLIIIISNAFPEENNGTNNHLEYQFFVNTPPRARLTANGEELPELLVEPDETVTFDGSASSDKDGELKDYHFDFGDGQFRDWASNPTVQHSYLNGEYQVLFRVRDDLGAVNQSSIFVISNLAPDASAGEDMEGTKGEDLLFLGAGSDDDELALFSWDFQDDGIWDHNSSKDGKSSHSYDEVGTYLARFRVVDSHGAASEDWLQVKISEPGAPEVEAGEDATVFLAKELSFRGNASDREGSIREYAWDFQGNGSWDYVSALDGNTSHTYNAVGNYKAVFRATDNEGNENTDIRIVTVHQAPVATISRPETGSIFTTEDDIIFHGSESYDPDGGELDYLWNSNVNGVIGDSSQFSTRLPEGQHEITLTVTDELGASTQNSTEIEVNYYGNHPPKIIILAPSPGGAYSEDVPVFFDASDSYDDDGDRLSYQWEFTQNDTILSSKYSFYTNLPQGSYNITLKLSDGHSLVKRYLEFLVSATPVAVIKTLQTIYDSGEQITLDASDSHDEGGDHLEFNWHSSLDGLLGEDELLRTKLSDGSHEITLTVTDQYGFAGSCTVVLELGTRVKRSLGLNFLDEFSQEAQPGDACSFHFVLQNEGELENTILLDYALLLHGWEPAFFSQGSHLEDQIIALPPSSETEVKMELLVPKVRKGQTQEVDITVTSLDDDALELEFSVTIDVLEYHSLNLNLSTQRLQFSDPGENQVFELKVRNEGNENQRFFLSISGVEGYSFLASQDSFSLDMNEEITLQIQGEFRERTGSGTLSSELHLYVYSAKNMDQGGTVLLPITTLPGKDDNQSEDSPGFGFISLALALLAMIKLKNRRKMKTFLTEKQCEAKIG